MTLPRFNQLIDYWLDLPPTHVSMTAIKSALLVPKKKQSEALDEDGMPLPPQEQRPPSKDGIDDIGLMASPASPFGDAFGSMKKMRVIEIDNTKPKPQ